MDTENMDSQLFLYDMPPSGADSIKENQKAENSRQAFCIFNEDIFPDISELDPDFESSHNIQDLINKEGLLFPELLSTSASNPEEGATSQVYPEVSQLELLDINLPYQMPVAYDGDYPTIKVTSNQGVEAEDEVIVIKPEDLAALGVTLSGDLALIPEANTEGISLIPEIKYSCEFDLDESCTSIDSPQLQFGAVSTSGSSGISSRRKLKAESPSKSAVKRNRNLDKNSEDYLERRQRNNVAVRKSRDKAKVKQQETEGKVQGLTDQNDRLQKKVDLLTKELTVLKGLFTNVGAAIPDRLAALLK